ncbi:hypothetical protein N7462_007796 [Penicillium macrosclerotiorum]|uniref:uncharacterized protein n=1 Tax=Penicillium macrosclerotiorum TaxID=303699 RepID=UPI0025478592|nr:uncharacterized protein N7462_007796 [Penicillium macrosclerotiorum]KAJ5679552.1 hypothetical protein N7462_007796 [Penicillium macrosclerotiorum]
MSNVPIHLPLPPLLPFTMSVEEGTHKLPDGLEAYTKTWKSDGQPRAIIAFIHGFSDHCNAYYELFPTLASSGIEIRAFDQRGWGRTFKTPKERGNTGGTDVVLADIHSFLLSIVPHAAASNTPLFLMGHSMGGGEVLNYVLHPDSPYYQASPRPKLAGLLAYSPLVALHPSTRPFRITVAAGRLTARLFPRMQRASPIDPTIVSRDPQVATDYVNDELSHDIGTFGGLAGMLDRGLWLEKLSQGDVKGMELLPMWFAHGDADQVTSWDATKRLAGLLGSKGDVVFCSYDGGYHRLSADLKETTDKFVKDLLDWILARSPLDGNKAKL